MASFYRNASPATAPKSEQTAFVVALFPIPLSSSTPTRLSAMLPANPTVPIATTFQSPTSGMSANVTIPTSSPASKDIRVPNAVIAPFLPVFVFLRFKSDTGSPPRTPSSDANLSAVIAASEPT